MLRNSQNKQHYANSNTFLSKFCLLYLLFSAQIEENAFEISNAGRIVRIVLTRTVCFATQFISSSQIPVFQVLKSCLIITKLGKLVENKS